MVNVRANFLFVIFDGEFEGCSRIGNSPRNLQLVLITRRQRDVGERQKVGGRVLATMGRTPRSTTRRINRLKSTIADLLQPAIFRPPDFLALSPCLRESILRAIVIVNHIDELLGPQIRIRDMLSKIGRNAAERYTIAVINGEIILVRRR